MKNNVTPFVVSIALHLGIIAGLILIVPAASYRLNAAALNAQPVVRAAVVDAAQVAEQVQAIQSREAQQQAAEQQRVQELQAQAEAARQQKLKEEQRLEQIKVDQKKAEQQAKLEEQRLAQLKIAQAKAQELKKQQEAAQAKEKALEAARQKQIELAAKEAALQQQLMQQQMANERQQLLKVKQMQGVIDQYRARVLMAIGNQWLIPDGADPTISSVFTIDLTPAGVVSHVQLIRSSGNPALDRSAETAIYKASPLPVPQDPTAFAPFRHFTLKMTPQDIAHP